MTRMTGRDRMGSMQDTSGCAAREAMKNEAMTWR
jgi:hypothetical protein